MKATNYLVTYDDLTTMGLTPKGSPATGNRIATKLFITTNYYVDEAASPFASYSNDRCPPYQTIISAPPPTYYTWYISYGLGDPSVYGCDSSGPFPTTVYSDNPSFVSSTQFFTDSGLNYAFNGSSYWYADSTFDAATEIQIDASGNNINSYGC